MEKSSQLLMSDSLRKFYKLFVKIDLTPIKFIEWSYESLDAKRALLCYGL